MLVAPQSHAAPLSMQKVTENVYAIVGELGQRSPENLGNNATFGLIVTGAGAVLVDPGGTYKGAQAIEKIVRTVTDQPITHVIDTGGQDHRWLGNGYFKSKGATIIASQAAVEDQKARYSNQVTMLENLVKPENTQGTEPVHADQTFATSTSIQVGGIEIQIHHPGPAHTPGDSYVWLPKSKVVFTGDIAYTERLLAVTSESKSAAWIKAFEQVMALNPAHVVPGHGHATSLAAVKKDTYDYLVALRAAVKAHYDQGLGLEKIGLVKLPDFAYLKNYEQLNGFNANRVYQELEWE
jgi:glyoxylase-like metal-dependent hydrolase (beta-lactamase superfamily II)